MSAGTTTTRCFLQAKEAEASVLEEFVGKSGYANHGERVVAGQHLMQAVSDIFLGWDQVQGPDGVTRDFYLRQLRDWKGSFEIEGSIPPGLTKYAGVCALALARAHARSGDRIAIASYLGNGTTFDRAIAEFAEVYADQNERDYEGPEGSGGQRSDHGPVRPVDCRLADQSAFEVCAGMPDRDVPLAIRVAATADRRQHSGDVDHPHSKLCDSRTEAAFAFRLTSGLETTRQEPEHCKRIMELCQRFLELLPRGALGRLTGSLDLGYQLQAGHMNQTERSFHVLPGVELAMFLIQVSACPSGSQRNLRRNIHVERPSHITNLFGTRSVP